VRIAEPLFPNDDGLADPSLQTALAGDDRFEIVAALVESRVFVALLAELESASVSLDGVKIEQESQMSLTWLVEGSVRALPIFSSIAAMTAWNPAARPLGVEAQRAAIVALAEGGIAVLDPGSAISREISASALRSLALGYEYLPLSIDEEVAAAVDQALSACLGQGIGYTLTDGADLEITLSCPGSIPSQEALSAFAARLAGDDRIRLRLESGLEIKIASR
jgi:hypothetical protein